MQRASFAVIGGGITGVGVALELAARGQHVDLYEQHSECLTQASADNEGKLHLGFVYANDRSNKTAECMIAGALSFRPLLERWLGRELDDVRPSHPFHYFVHKDSLLDPDELGAYYEHVTARITAAADGKALRCFGDDPRSAVRRLSASEREALCDDRTVVAAFGTPEIAVDPHQVARLLRQRVMDDPRVRVLRNTTVIAVSPAQDCVTLRCRAQDTPLSERYEHVVNASWESLLALDKTAGVEPRGPWSFRVKHYIRVSGTAHLEGLPSATIVIGPFGDIVRYPGGDLYLSWYPSGRRGMSTELRPPPWPLKLEGAAADEVRDEAFAALRAIAPGLAAIPPARLRESTVRGGIILAQGTSDVDDRASGLHRRADVGPRSFGRYHSVDTGKFTTGPLFAEQIARRLAG